MGDPSFASARNIDELTDVPLDGLPATDVDRIESDLLAPTDDELALIAGDFAGGFLPEYEVPRLIAAVRALRIDLRIANETTLVLLGRCVAAEAEAERLRAENARLRLRAGITGSDSFRLPEVRQGSSLHVGDCPRANPSMSIGLDVLCTCRESGS